MRHILAMTLAVLLSAGAASAQDWEAGVAAIRQGDYVRAKELLEPLAENGDKYAQDLLGGMYLEGNGVSANPAEAASWFKLAAKQGHAYSQYQLGVLYLEGRGVVEDRAAAALLFLLAANQGIDRAQFSIGFMFANGIGVSKDDAQAVHWFKRAAEQGHPSAQNHLGVMYAKGLGVPQEFVPAHMWFNIACALENKEGCDNRDKVEKLLAATDTSNAQRRARVCMDSDYKDCD